MFVPITATTLEHLVIFVGRVWRQISRHLGTTGQREERIWYIALQTQQKTRRILVSARLHIIKST
jgi:hypothetical protein